jgi:hypothetical protein
MLTVDPPLFISLCGTPAEAMEPVPTARGSRGTGSAQRATGGCRGGGHKSCLIPGSYPCAANAAYRRWPRPVSSPRRGQDDADAGANRRAFMGRSFEAKSSRVSSISFGVFALLTPLVNLFKSGVGGLRAAKAWTAIGSLHEQKNEEPSL